MLNNADKSVTFYNQKSQNDLRIQIDIQTYNRAFKICFNTIENNYMKWLQYKILTRILGTKSLKLFKMKIKIDSICRLCNMQDETLVHIFTQCLKITMLLENLTLWIRNKLNIIIDFNSTTIILGYLNILYFLVLWEPSEPKSNRSTKIILQCYTDQNKSIT